MNSTQAIKSLAKTIALLEHAKSTGYTPAAVGGAPEKTK